MDRTDLPLVEAPLAGALSFVVGYLVTYLWQASSVRETLSGLNVLIEFVGGETIPVWKAVGWLFYNAHTVAIQVPALGTGDATRSVIGGGGAPSLLYVVPPLVLLLVGAVVARWDDADGYAEGAVAGATMVAGYFVLAVVGTFLFRYAIQDAFVGPPLVRSVVLVGIVYPVVFGGIGGALGGELG